MSADKEEDYISNYNKNYFDDAFGFFASRKGIRTVSPGYYAYVENLGDEKIKMIRTHNKQFYVMKQSNFPLEEDVWYSPFDIIRILKFEGNGKKAFNYVKYDVLCVEVDYVRVGTKYFKTIAKIDRFNIKRTELKLWDKQTLVDDYGKPFLRKIPAYDDFTIVPDNKNYERIHGNMLNLYAPFEHQPYHKDDFKGKEDFPWTNQLMEHLFGEQIELGWIYLKCLYDLPKQALPILVLTSEERQTGKTTFVDWFTILFGANSVIINPQDIGNSHNSSYTDKNIIIIEESRFESTQATEKLKNLATQKNIMVNPKFVQQYSIPFFGKLIITSNDENKFSKVDNEEIRYWVRKVPTLKGKANHQILDDLIKEIPYVLRYLYTLKEIDKSKSRMIFDAAEIETEALKVVKNSSKQEAQKAIEDWVDDHATNNRTVKEFYCQAIDVKRIMFPNNSQWNSGYIKTVLKDQMKLVLCDKDTVHIPFEEDVNIQQKTKHGFPFIFPNPYYGIDENETEKTENIILDDSEPDDLPF